MDNLDDTMFARPDVFATESDLPRLRAIAANGSAGAAADLLSEEVRRMSLAADWSDRRFVNLGALVSYKDLRTKRVRHVRVVAPGSARQDDNHVSVASPIGAALIGLPEGSIFRWRNGDGGTRAVKVLHVQE